MNILLSFMNFISNVCDLYALSCSSYDEDYPIGAEEEVGKRQAKGKPPDLPNVKAHKQEDDSSQDIGDDLVSPAF